MHQNILFCVPSEQPNDDIYVEHSAKQRSCWNLGTEILMGHANVFLSFPNSRVVFGGESLVCVGSHVVVSSHTLYQQPIP